ncbi:hypothetical protein RRG08_044118 [Elysia crispata]|uniref:G-protein coupled receptors family 1 profile domain-containing protein n=1 Tax=Elysia crispata TaxID=231223 RepID=A0AAE1DBA1_9GAST|nr:hypothetical protein RRG08_044118 [Elysia crispata]
MTTGNETTSQDSNEDVLFWALNGYGVTVFHLVVAFLTLLLAIAIIVLNALVFDTMVRGKRNFEPADVLVCSLSIADLMTGVLMVHNTAYNVLNFQDYLECLFRCGLMMGLLSTSVLHLAFLTVDRYVKIIMTYRYEQIFTINSLIIIALVLWVVSLTISFSPAMGWNVNLANITTDLNTAIPPGDDVPVCSVFGIIPHGFLNLILSLFFVPFFLMGVLYLHIFQVANRHARSIAAQEATNGGKDIRDSHAWKYTKTVFILMGLYLLCWIPAGAVIILFVTGHLQQFTVVDQGTYLAWTLTLGCANSAINPIVYAIKISAVRQRFRREFRRFLFCCFGCCGYKGGLLQPTGKTTVFSVGDKSDNTLTRFTLNGEKRNTREI